ncbi:MAG: ABC transporter permease [Rhodospirillales bacterium]
MNLLTLSIAYIRDRALNTALNLLLLALGVATIVVLMLFSDQFTNRLTQDARGIHLVIGAKGSPLQLILSTIYHVDIPTGNIPVKEAAMIGKHRLIKSAIPLALGDAHRGFRIVGTEHGYPAIYRAEVAEGRLWEKPFEATIGARVAKKTGLKVGDTFAGAHGVAGTGAEHEDNPYRVVGIFKPTGAVIDRLIMTPVESIWIIHEMKDKAKAASPMDMMQAPEDREITALLVRYRSPIAAISLPRFINSRTGMQAASPGFEIKRLMALVGVGIDTLRGFGLLLIGTAALSMFIALYNAMQERRYDLVIMRSLGATRATLLRQVVLEGLIMAGAGTVLGIVLGHAVTGLLGQVLPQARAMGLSGVVWLPAEWYLFLLAATVGIVATALPAAQAYRADIAVTLASR